MNPEPSKKDWIKYEELAAIIYEKIEPNSIVKHDDKIYGNLSERYRQIDISIRSHVAGHEILVIVDAKDRTRAPDVNTIENFSKTMEDVAASRGVIICRKKPNESNIKLASKYGIDICAAIDIKDHKWKEQIKIPLLVKLKELNVELGFKIIQKGPMYMDLPPKWLISQNGGVTFDIIGKYVLDAISNYKSVSGNYTLNAPKNALSISVGNATENRSWHPLEWFTIFVESKDRNVFRYCDPTEYRALRNFSSNKTIISELKMEIPDFRNSNEWLDSSKIDIKSLDSFAVTDMIISNLKLYQNKREPPVIKQTTFEYIDK